MPDTTYKVVIKDDERETITLCAYKKAMAMIRLAQELGHECKISEVEEG